MSENDILDFLYGLINTENNLIRVGEEALSVGITEELLKFLVVMLIIYPNKNFDEPFDGIVYAVFVGMGFATAENLAFVMNGSASLAIMRMLSAVPAHFVFAVIMGYYLGKAKTIILTVTLRKIKSMIIFCFSFLPPNFDTQHRE